LYYSLFNVPTVNSVCKSPKWLSKTCTGGCQVVRFTFPSDFMDESTGPITVIWLYSPVQ